MSMGALLAYSIIVSFLLIPLYFLVKLGLSGTTFHSFTRKIILACYGIAVVIPFLYDIDPLHSSELSEVSIDLPVFAEIVDDDSPGVSAVISSVEPALWIKVAIAVYAAGLLFFVIRDAIILFRMFRLFSQCETVGINSRWKILVHNCNDVAPFSWTDRIVISHKDFSEGRDAIIAHEAAHLDRYHSIDLFIAEMLTILTWYNPASWLMRDELCTVHEYETDEAVLRQGFNARDYQLLLIKKAVGSRFPSIANSLDHSNLSKRIKMMLRKQTSPRRRWIAAAAFPAVALTAVMLSTNSVASTISEISEAKITDFSVNEQVVTTSEALIPEKN